MMALFIAYRIMGAKVTFAEVPILLQPDVRKILVEEGYGHLAK